MLVAYLKFTLLMAVSLDKSQKMQQSNDVMLTRAVHLNRTTNGWVICYYCYYIH